MRLSIRLGLPSLFILLGALPSAALPPVGNSAYFADPPELVRAISTEKVIDAPHPEYGFTLRIPGDAGAPVARVVIQQQQGYDNHLDFDLAHTRLYLGDSYSSPKAPVGNVTYNPATRSIAIFFNPPLAPGQTVTVGISPYQNPRVPGVYLFGVTAYPQGENPQGQFLGYGRLNFYGYGFFR